MFHRGYCEQDKAYQRALEIDVVKDHNYHKLRR